MNIFKMRRIEFLKQFLFFKFNKSKVRFQLNFKDRYPCLNDNTSVSGFDRHYVYHTAWAARIIAEISPSRHIDISSDLRFSTIVSAFVPIEFYDYRPANIVLNNYKTGSADLLDLHFEDLSIYSLSCMHVIEHIGLGRYGDTLDYDGDLKAIKELSRVLAHNGNLLFVVPIGKEPKIMFNAHRIYSKEQVLDFFIHEKLECKEFAIIPEDSEDGGIIINPSSELIDRQVYGCGCFWFIKK
ncbi:MAG: hypothetical protein CVV49_02470 [Spirochaetae bacterium HGW-Spirochaetae-5]|nr:MAG: hypothetical protein CVV49_02470 [Spirochaetae bacterium HGW-Spirochaetae-5]